MPKSCMPADTSVGPNHEWDVPKYVAPINTKTEFGIWEMELSITDYIKSSQQLVNMVWIREHINRIKSYVF